MFADKTHLMTQHLLATKEETLTFSPAVKNYLNPKGVSDFSLGTNFEAEGNLSRSNKVGLNNALITRINGWLNKELETKTTDTSRPLSLAYVLYYYNFNHNTQTDSGKKACCSVSLSSIFGLTGVGFLILAGYGYFNAHCDPSAKTYNTCVQHLPAVSKPDLLYFEIGAGILTEFLACVFRCFKKINKINCCESEVELNPLQKFALNNPNALKQSSVANYMLYNINIENIIYAVMPEATPIQFTQASDFLLGIMQAVISKLVEKYGRVNNVAVNINNFYQPQEYSNEHTDTAEVATSSSINAASEYKSLGQN
jgi:hypothetical protein